MKNVGVSPREIGPVIAHGTGAPVGDTAEIIAINEVFSEGLGRGDIDQGKRRAYRWCGRRDGRAGRPAYATVAVVAAHRFHHRSRS
jgi:hypothetical protein